jgi:hypothetical protein
VIFDITSATRVGIGALEPTHGHAVETAAAGWAAATASSDADDVARANAMISGLFLDMIPPAYALCPEAKWAGKIGQR